MPLYEAMIQIYKETRPLMNKKTERNKAIYEYLKQCWDEAGDVPTHREIAQACNISLATVSDGLSMLEAQGRITRQAYKARSIRLVENDKTDDASRNDQAEEVYQYLVKRIESGQIPSHQDIAEALYLSRGVVRQALNWLETEKRIEVGDGQRKIHLL